MPLLKLQAQLPHSTPILLLRSPLPVPSQMNMHFIQMISACDPITSLCVSVRNQRIFAPLCMSRKGMWGETKWNQSEFWREDKNIIYIFVLLLHLSTLYAQEKYILNASAFLAAPYSFPHSDLGAAQCDCSFLLLTSQQLCRRHSVTPCMLL